MGGGGRRPGQAFCGYRHGKTETAILRKKGGWFGGKEVLGEQSSRAGVGGRARPFRAAVFGKGGTQVLRTFAGEKSEKNPR